MKTAKHTKSFKHPNARALYENRKDIVAEWVSLVKAEVSSAQTLEKPIIVDTIPLFLEDLAEVLDSDSAMNLATRQSNMPEEHGSERARVTPYGPEQILQEYQILRRVILLKMADVAELTSSDYARIQTYFDDSMRSSVSAYFLVHGRLREQFIATLTHDLRNPISAVKMAADLIIKSLKAESDKASPELISNLAETAIKNVKRADRMIQDLLDASVVQYGEVLPVHLSQGNVKTVVEEAVFGLTSEERSRLKVEMISYVGHWDLEIFQRAVENLISNAFKYGEDSKPITVRVQECHGRIMVSVHNCGNPILGQNIEYLFQAFRRSEAAIKSEKRGWGIGLALARSAAERMGGSLGVESSIEKGTTFTIDLPADARPFINAPTST